MTAFKINDQACYATFLPESNRTPIKILVAAAVSALCLPMAAHAKCSHTTTITNSSGIVLRFVELKSAVSPPTLFKKQWSGERVIQPGGTTTINWTSDWNCVDSGTGQSNHWDVKFIRKNGTVHYCGNLSQGQDVRVDTPDLCYPS